MPKRRFRFDLNQPEQLEITWEGRPIEKNVKIFFEGKLVGSIDTYRELAEGKIFTLPDASSIQVTVYEGQLQVYRNGKPLHLIYDVTRQYRIFYYLFAFNLILIVLGVSAILPIAIKSILTLSICTTFYIALFYLADKQPVFAFSSTLILYVVQWILLSFQFGNPSWAIAPIFAWIGHLFDAIIASRKLKMSRNNGDLTYSSLKHEEYLATPNIYVFAILGIRSVIL